MGEITSPSEIAGIQEANTAVLPSGMPLNELMLRAGQLHFAHAEAKKQAQEKAIQEHLKMFDIDSVGVWNEGIPAIEKYKQDGLKKFYNVDWLKKYDSRDLGALQEYSQWKDGLQSQITNEKLAAEYYKQKKEQLKDPNYQVMDADGVNTNQVALDNWVKKGSHNLSEAPDYQYQTPYNAMIPQQIAANIKPESGTLETKMADGSTVTKTGEVIPTEKVLNAVNQYFNANPQNQNGLTTGYVSLVNNPHLPNALETQVGIYVNDKGEYAKPQKVKDPTTGVEVIQTIPFKSVPLSDATPLQMAQSQAMESVNQQYKETQTNAPKGDGTTNKIIPYQEGLATNLNVGNKPTGQGDTKTPNKYESVGSIGGWDFSATAQRPQNINYRAPKYWMNAKTNTVVETAAPYKTIDIVGVYDKKIKPSDNQLGFTIVANPDDEAAKDLEVKRFAMVKDDKNTTFLVPYDEAIHNSLINSGVKADGLTTGDLISPNGTTNTGTQQQGGVTDLGNIFGAKK